MQRIDLLVQPRWLIPVQPEGMVLEAHSLAVRDGRIEAILPNEEAARLYSAEQTITLPDHALLPGLINAHTHAAMTLMRGLADDLPLMQWLNQHIWPAESDAVSDDYVSDGMRLACAEFIRGGQTCFADMYFFPETGAAVVEEAGLRAAIGLILIDFPTPYAQDADDYLHKALAVHDQLRGHQRLKPMFAPHGPYTVSDAPLRKMRAYAKELGLGVHMHVHETADEIQGGLATTGERPLARLDGLDLLDSDFMAVHMTQLTAEEIDKVARNGVHVVHCPQSNLKLASGFCPVAQLMEAGVNVALGTDGAASNNDLDLLDEMRTAAMLAKAVAGRPSAVAAARALSMATINGARALGMDAEIGSLEVGKAADFIAIDLSDVSTQPVYDPIAQIVYCASRHQITDNFVAGQPLMRQRQLLSVDAESAIARANAWQHRLRPYATERHPRAS
ncbi:TRZ/ATZ family hydrolase [Algiphilus sp.]|uniref:TRZ/ATZ family hydrolase n=1 Tax=Algiphilus sp. TaxID=1872431 RepID=UPI003B529BFB